MNREIHVRWCEGLRGRATRPPRLGGVVPLQIIAPQNRPQDHRFAATVGISPPRSYFNSELKFNYTCR